MQRVHVDGNQLLRWQDEISQFGKLSNGGIDRQALTEAEIDARLWLVELAQSLSLEAFSDPIGNLFLRAEGVDPSLSPILSGSHLDSQPDGGRYDGTFGVLASLAAVLAVRKAGIGSRSFEVVSWTNEEGTRFSPGVMGSRAFVGPSLLEDYLEQRDVAGISLREAVARWDERSRGIVRQRPLGFKPAALIEAHIEQGPVLEGAGKAIGIVNLVQGLKRFSVDVRGVAAHAGTTPRANRRDALVGAIELIVRMNEATRDQNDILRFTVGRLTVEPGSPSVVPARVNFTIDLRHPDKTTLDEVAKTLSAICAQGAAGCVAEFTLMAHSEPQRFSDLITSALENAANDCGYSCMRMPSGAGHDAQIVNAICPSGMLFIPCRGGISHNQAEFAEPDHIVAGADVLACALTELKARL